MTKQIGQKYRIGQRFTLSRRSHPRNNGLHPVHGWHSADSIVQGQMVTPTTAAEEEQRTKPETQEHSTSTSSPTRTQHNPGL